MIEKLNLPKKELHIFLCVNVREAGAVKPSCGPKIDMEEYKKLKLWLKLSTEYSNRVKLTRTLCLDVCPLEGFVVLVYPSQEYYRLNSLEEIKELIKKYLG